MGTHRALLQQRQYDLEVAIGGGHVEAWGEGEEGSSELGGAKAPPGRRWERARNWHALPPKELTCDAPRVARINGDPAVEEFGHVLNVPIARSLRNRGRGRFHHGAHCDVLIMGESFCSPPASHPPPHSHPASPWPKE